MKIFASPKKVRRVSQPSRQKIRKNINLVDPVSRSGISIPYTLVISQRARRLSMKIGLDRGLEVVIPPRFNQARVEPFMTQHHDWIIKNIKKHTARQKQIKSNQISDGSRINILGKPKTIRIRTTNKKKSYAKVARALKFNSDSAYFDEEEIVIYLSENSPDEIKKTLETHLKKEAKKIFAARTTVLAARMNLSYNRITIKSQKTRWGSCSKNKNLNFNWRLILTEPQIIDSIIIHELAHLVHMNHGRRFYNLVEKYCPDHKALNKKLKETIFPI